MTKRNIVHIEIPAADVSKAGEFYKSLLGWEIQPMPEMDYTMWDAGDGPAGGFPKISDNTITGEVLIIINSEDIEADLKKAASLGGTIVNEKAEIPNTGWYAIFKDPTGNTIGPYTSKNPDYNK